MSTTTDDRKIEAKETADRAAGAVASAEPSADEQAAAEAFGVEVSPDIITKKFIESFFMIVEDDPRAVDEIQESLQTKRYKKGSEEKEDAGISFAKELTEVESKFRKLIESASQSSRPKIIVIEDMELVFPDDGVEAMKKMVSMVKEWNEQHPKQPLELEIIMNSTTEFNPDDLNGTLGGKYIVGVHKPRGPHGKKEVVSYIEEYFRRESAGA